jgi:PAS domain S-box-containing protein
MNEGLIRVLLVEDDPEDYLLTSDVLGDIKGMQFDVDWAKTYEAAIAALEQQRHDIGLVDYQLGKHTGLEVLQGAKKLGCRIPLVMLTGQDDRKIDVKAMEAGAADYLIKGRIDAPTLERTIRYTIEHVRTTETLRQSEENFRQVIASISAHIYQMERTADGAWQNHYLSPNIKALTGHPYEKFVSGSDFLATLVYPLDKQITVAHLKKLSQGQNSQVTYRLVRADGEIIWVNDDARVVKDAVHGRLVVYGVVTDVSERVSSNEALASRAVELETVAQVSTAIVTIMNRNELLQTVANLTKERFDLYHVHIYLLDTAGDMLNVVAGAGIIGERMVAEGWRIPLQKERSLVARAARSRKPVVVNDVLADPDFLANPLLPDTRSELAVPLIAGSQLLGVLDVQSDYVEHFTDDAISIQSTLAAQIATALQNAEQYELTQQVTDQLGKRVRELNCLNEVGREMEATPPVAQLLRWVTQRIPAAMQYPEQCVVAIEFDDELYGLAEAVALPAQMTHGLYIKGYLMGRVYIAYTEKHDFLDEESAMLGAVASRLSGYIENRRLLDETAAVLAEVKQSQEMLETVINATPDWIFIKDREHRYRLANQAYADSMKITPKEFIGKNDLEIGFPEDIVRGNPEKGIRGFWPDDREVMESGQTKIIEVEPAVIDGRPVYLSTVKVPLRDRENNVWGVLGYVRDITEREQLLAQVEQRARREQAIRQITEKMRAAASLEQLVKTTAQELGERLSAGHAVVVLGLDTSTKFSGQSENGR